MFNPGEVNGSPPLHWRPGLCLCDQLLVVTFPSDVVLVHELAVTRLLARL
jgi:hypothetical protein